jgi:hypothetical protein
MHVVAACSQLESFLAKGGASGQRETIKEGERLWKKREMRMGVIRRKKASFGSLEMASSRAQRENIYLLQDAFGCPSNRTLDMIESCRKLKVCELFNKRKTYSVL